VSHAEEQPDGVSPRGSNGVRFRKVIFPACRIPDFGVTAGSPRGAGPVGVPRLARKLRLEFPGATDHVINRGNYRSWIFLQAKARAAFEATLFCGHGASPRALPTAAHASRAAGQQSSHKEESSPTSRCAATDCPPFTVIAFAAARSTLLPCPGSCPFPWCE